MRACLKKEWKLAIRSRMFQLLLVLCFLFLGIANFVPPLEEKEIEPPFHLGVVDLEKDTYTDLLLSYFRNNEAFAGYVSLEEGSEEQIREMFQNGEIDAYLIIPERFVERMIRLEYTPIKVYLDTSDKTKAAILNTLLSAYSAYIISVENGCTLLYDQMIQDGFSMEEVDSANIDISFDLIFTALKRNDFFHFQEVEERKELPLPLYYCFALLGVLPTLFGIAAGTSLYEEERLKVAGRLRTAGVSFSSYFGAKWLFFSLLASVITSAIYGVVSDIEGVKKLEVIGIIILASFLLVLFMMGIVWLCQGVKSYLSTSCMGILLFLIMSGGIIPISYLPEIMKQTANFLPIRYIPAVLFEVETGGNLSFLWYIFLLLLLLLAFFVIRFFAKGRQVQYED